MIVSTQYFVEYLGHHGIINRAGPINDKLEAIAIQKEHFPKGRVLREIKRVEVIYDVVYPEGISVSSK